MQFNMRYILTFFIFSAISYNAHADTDKRPAFFDTQQNIELSLHHTHTTEYREMVPILHDENNNFTNWLIQHQNLHKIELPALQLEGVVTNLIGQLPYLNYIDLSHNNITGFDGTLFESQNTEPRHITLHLEGNPLQYFYAPADENVFILLGEPKKSMPYMTFDGRHFHTERDFSRLVDIIHNSNILAPSDRHKQFEIRFCKGLSPYLRTLGFQRDTRIRITRDMPHLNYPENIQIINLYSQKKQRHKNKKLRAQSKQVYSAQYILDLIHKNAVWDDDA